MPPDLGEHAPPGPPSLAYLSMHTYIACTPIIWRSPYRSYSLFPPDLHHARQTMLVGVDSDVACVIVKDYSVTYFDCIVNICKARYIKELSLRPCKAVSGPTKSLKNDQVTRLRLK